MSPWSHPTTVPPGPMTRDLAPRPGVTLVEGGADVAVYAGHADAVELCLFDAGDKAGTSERRIPLLERAHGWWFAFVPGITAGQRYNFRAHGAWSPDQGLRHNPAKLLLDPYAKAIEGKVRWGAEVYGHVVDVRWHGDGELISDLDSRGHMPRGVVVDDRFDWEGDVAPNRSRSESVIYEAHVRNQTALHPGVPPELRGTYAGLAHPASVAHLTSLGVTAVELLPVHAFTHEPHLVRRGLTNHWGYNTLGFFAPHGAYAAAKDPQGAVDELKGMVKLLHGEGIEVILDVVYNHTAEQGRTGAMLSWRGLDQRAYYRLDERGRDIDVTGCGNTLDLRHPVVCRMVLDSLRYWVQEYHVDGFRFDLAVALGRGRGDDFDPDHPFLVALRTDPVLSAVKLIAEPWDVGMHGWRTGQFPPPFMEWNDRYRDAVRRFWVGDVRSQRHHRRGHGLQELATRLAGSRDLFGHRDRGPTASINFVAAHDGFTTADLVAYDTKHNEANGEDNRDGSDNNGSWNHGTEGPSDDPQVIADRTLAIRNLMGTLLLSTGVPMINAGDELGRSQGGNNNPYCQDNGTSWINWDLEPWQQDLLDTTSHLIRVRQALPVLRQRVWALGRQVHDDGTRDMEWYAADGTPMGDRWTQGSRLVQLYVAGAWMGWDSALLVVNGGVEDVEVTLPEAPGVTTYRLLWDSTWSRPRDGGDPVVPGPVTVGATSLRVYAASDVS
ncbi:MAG TPA: glycogen debranching protein GlgX [Ornithinibacter sp.]|jgi:isoamylase|uniref:glycogen debranching protein GlgX n=1 Tax=Ornithinibacter sp. TaxID=2862748 RepID=UPI002C674F83|nr:glycogen debranching protein GlgX [Ornithinibacter sp.]HQV83118.1 glycogen debranching protein GlgX [Ornithinibacter sp.]HQW74018.1 glycogen debranching protein GlgX [Ornithinibacter sp.]HQX88174.1 glycogen debranching protein GlgX [Ornithinibacter sp.]HQZ09469.1 glycogen debranching protein GlgX [Ornithinibacter sp.]HRA25443.1 glycogen debranching protein GlgX [Ornithinibacter sp.]